MKHCKCAELVISHADGTKTLITPPAYPGGRHDCKEVARRNTFLDLACERAIRAAGSRGNPVAFSTRFTRELSEEMDRLCAEPVTSR